jgi:spore coat protein CotH
MEKDQTLFGYRMLKLRAMIPIDPSYMKEFLAYDMYNSIGLPTTKYSYVRVFINNDPIGLFGFTENFKNPWLRNEFANGDKDYNQGTMFVAGTSKPDPNAVGKTTGIIVKNGVADLGYLGNDLSPYERGIYDVKEKPSNKKSDFSHIRDLTKFIADASNTTTDDSVVPRWENMINVDSFLRGLALEILIGNVDGYYGFAHNYLLYNDSKTKRIYFSGQDLDLSMGIYAVPEMLTGNYSEYINFNTRPLSKMFNVPQFKKTFEQLLLHMTNTLMIEEVLISRIDQVYNMLRDDVEWDRSLPKKGELKLAALGAAMVPKTPSKTASTLSDLFKVFKTITTDVPDFSQAINGPMPNNITVILPLKAWVRTKRSNVLKFFNKSSNLGKL